MALWTPVTVPVQLTEVGLRQRSPKSSPGRQIAFVVGQRVWSTVRIYFLFETVHVQVWVSGGRLDVEVLIGVTLLG